MVAPGLSIVALELYTVTPGPHMVTLWLCMVTSWLYIYGDGSIVWLVYLCLTVLLMCCVQVCLRSTNKEERLSLGSCCQSST